MAPPGPRGRRRRRQRHPASPPDRAGGPAGRAGPRRRQRGAREQAVGAAAVLVHPRAHAGPRRARRPRGVGPPGTGPDHHLAAAVARAALEPVQQAPSALTASATAGPGHRRRAVAKATVRTDPGGHRRTVPPAPSDRVEDAGAGWSGRQHPFRRWPGDGATAPPYSGDMAFRAFVVTRTDGTRAAVAELSDDDLPPGEVLIDVEWSAVNYKDAMVTVPGQPGGPDAHRWSRASTWPAPSPPARTRPSPSGTPVLVHGYDLGVARHGGFAERARVPAGWVVPLPAGLDARRAMVDRHRRLHRRPLAAPARGQLGLGPADGPVLVTGASGGVGSMAVALLARHGYEVVASSGKVDEHEYLRRLGAARGRRPRGPGRRRGAGPRRRALGRRRRLRGRRHPGLGAAHRCATAARWPPAASPPGPTLADHRLPLHRPGRLPPRAWIRCTPRIAERRAVCGRRWPTSSRRGRSTTWWPPRSASRGWTRARRRAGGPGQGPGAGAPGPGPVARPLARLAQLGLSRRRSARRAWSRPHTELMAG